MSQRINSNHSATKSKRSSVTDNAQSEEPELQFRGTHAHAELWELLFQGKITTTEHVLVQLIDGFVNCRGEGCFATTAHLALRMHVKERHLLKMLSHLKKIGIISHVGWKTLANGAKLRILETAWSRARPPAIDCIEPPVIKDTRPPVIKDTQSDTSSSKKSSKKHCRDSSPDGSPHRDRVSKFSFSNGKSTPSPSQRYANQLHELLLKKRLIFRRVQIQRWTKEFLALEEFVSREEIEKVLEWYSTHIGKKFIPQAYSATSFREKFPQLQAAMKKCVCLENDIQTPEEEEEDWKNNIVPKRHRL